MLLMSKIKNHELRLAGKIMTEKKTRIDNEKAVIKVPKTYTVQFSNYEHVFTHKNPDHEHLSKKEYEDMETALFDSVGWNLHYGEPSVINIDDHLPNVASLAKKQTDIMKAMLQEQGSDREIGLIEQNAKLQAQLEAAGITQPTEAVDFDSLTPSDKLKTQLVTNYPDEHTELYKTISDKKKPGLWNKIKEMDESQVDAYIEENK